MGNNTPNPYWQKAIQYQQKAQSRSQGRQETHQTRAQGRVQEDFTDDWRGKHVVTRVVEGASVTTVEGVVEDVSRYWLKVRVGNEVIYVNKAHIISIKFAEVKEPVGDANANK
jgi:hypothetical protein